MSTKAKKPSSTQKKNSIPKSTQKKQKQANQKHKKNFHNHKVMNLEQENEIFDMVINQKEKPLQIEEEEEKGKGMKGETLLTTSPTKKNSKRKNSSNLPTNNNSKNQTPKTSVDLSSPNKNEESKNYLSDFSTPNFHKRLIEKTSTRKYSTNSNYSNDGNDDPYFYPSSSNNKIKADNFKIKYKTELCKYYEINGTCKFGENCAYAHGKENLRAKVTKATAYRTKKCKQFFENGFCPYGNRCQFAHAIKSNIVNNPYDKDLTYSQTIQLLSKRENLMNIKEMNSMNRLPIFQSIVANPLIKSSLFEDLKQLSLQNFSFESVHSAKEELDEEKEKSNPEMDEKKDEDEDEILQLMEKNVIRIVSDF